MLTVILALMISGSLAWEIRKGLLLEMPKPEQEEVWLDEHGNDGQGV